MVELIRWVVCNKEFCTWEVYTDGKAYSDSNGAEGNPTCAYRDSSGRWFSTLVARQGVEVTASKDLEEVFSNRIAKLVVEPVDPLRHLRRRR